MDVRNIILNKNETLITALEMIKNSGKRCIIIINDKNIAIGTLSEGDLIEGFLRGQSFYSPIKDFYNRNFTYIRDDVKNTKAGKKLIIESFNKGITIIPILDDFGKPCGYLDYIDYLIRE